MGSDSLTSQNNLSVNIMIEFWQWLGCVCIWFLHCTAWSRSVEVTRVLGWCCLFLIYFFSLQDVTVGCTHINNAQINTEKDKHIIQKPLVYVILKLWNKCNWSKNLLVVKFGQMILTKIYCWMLTAVERLISLKNVYQPLPQPSKTKAHPCIRDMRTPLVYVVLQPTLLGFGLYVAKFTQSTSR